MDELKIDVAIIGAPNAGKSEFACALRDRLEEIEQDYVVVDGYTDYLKEYNSLGLGIGAGYVANLCVLAERLSREVYWLKEEQQTITVGTLVETATYLAIHAANVRNQDLQERNLTLMKLIGLIFADFPYHVYFLKVLPYDEHDYDDWQLQGEIQRTLHEFGLPYKILDSDSEEENLATAVRHIEETRASITELAEAEQQRLRPSREDGSNVEPPAGSVPDVPEQA